VVVRDGVLVVDRADESLIRDEQQSHSWCFIDAPALRLDDAVLDLVGHAQAVAATDGVRSSDKRDRIIENAIVDRNRSSLLESDRHILNRNLNR
jgi:hypothetical protein